MNSSKPQAFWQKAIANLSDRLREPLGWYPYPALISYGLAIVLIGHLIPGLNPRLGSRAEVIDLDAPRVPEGIIWLGLFAEDGQIVATTSERDRFEWPLSPVAKDLSGLATYLQRRQQKEAAAASLAHQTSVAKTMVLLAIDQRLKYIHIKPVLQLLAEAGIAQYGFETKIIASAATPAHH